MFSIHWLYRRSRNTVVKMSEVDIIATSHTTSTFNMADVNIIEHDSLMETPTLKSNARDQKLCKEKNLSWLFGADRKICPSGSLFGITWQSLVIPNSDPLSAPHTHDRFLYSCIPDKVFRDFHQC